MVKRIILSMSSSVMNEHSTQSTPLSGIVMTILKINIYKFLSIPFNCNQLDLLKTVESNVLKIGKLDRIKKNDHLSTNP
jgi:hypothetical protein